MIFLQRQPNLFRLMRNMVFILVIHIIATEAAGQATFRAAVVKANITPDNSQTLIGYAPRKSEGVRDSIYHKVVVLDDGKQQFYLVSSDLGAIAPPTYHETAEKLKKLYDIDEKHFWWANTHTHSAPEVGSSGVIELFLGDRYKEEYDKEYTAFVEDQLVKAVGEARRKLAAARLGVGWGYSRANINRRARGIDNKTFLGENPDGPVDRKIGLLRVETEDGKLMALIANYPIHGTVLSISDLRISGDVPGEVASYVEKKTGAPLLFINGAEGNIAPRFSVSINNGGNKDGFLKQFRRLLGDPILDANDRIQATTGDVEFNAEMLLVETPLRPDIKRWPEDMPQYIRTSSADQMLIRMPIRFLNINDEIAIWAAPCELFCEVSNYIRAQSPFPFTFYYGITNGTLGYLPSKQEFSLGGYELDVSPFTPDAAGHLMDRVVEFLDMQSRGSDAKVKPD